MNENVVLQADDGGVRTLTLNRPESRNALNPDLVGRLHEALRKTRGDSSVRVIVLRGAGEAFCAGADLKVIRNLQSATSAENHEDSHRLRKLYLELARYPKPVIASVHGPALAGGCGLAALCDFILASPEATFGYPEVRIGFVAAMVLVFLQRSIGDRKAREILLTGRIIPAEEAASMGLIERVVPGENLADETAELAGRIMKNAPSSLAFTKKLLHDCSGMPLEQALELAATVNAAARDGADCKEGIAAFLEKRSPEWNP